MTAALHIVVTEGGLYFTDRDPAHLEFTYSDCPRCEGKGSLTLNPGIMAFTVDSQIVTMLTGHIEICHLCGGRGKFIDQVTAKPRKRGFWLF